MSGSVNKVILVGNVGVDPQIRAMQDGNKLANLSVATSERWKDKQSGEMKSKTEWHRVVVFDPNLVDVIERFVQKGSKLYLEGQLQTRKWQDQSGADKYTTEVVLQRFRGTLTLLDRKGETDTNFSADGDPSFQGQGSQNKQVSKSDVELDDEIPF
jgi:single-strand DNA-binding protein